MLVCLADPAWRLIEFLQITLMEEDGFEDPIPGPESENLSLETSLPRMVKAMEDKEQRVDEVLATGLPSEQDPELVRRSFLRLKEGGSASSASPCNMQDLAYRIHRCLAGLKSTSSLVLGRRRRLVCVRVPSCTRA